MSEEKEVAELKPADKVQIAANAYANKCCLLGQMVYKMDKANKDFDLDKHNVLIDVDKLAKEYDALLAKQNGKIEEPKAEVVTP